MSRTCTICTHTERTAIEAAIVAGTANRDIACKFSVGRMSIERHATAHIVHEVKQAQAAREEARGLDVVKQLKAINGVTLAILQEARKAGENDTALRAVDRVTKQLELQAKLTGAIDAQPEDTTPQDGLLIPFDRLSARTRMEIRRLLAEDEAVLHKQTEVS